MNDNFRIQNLIRPQGGAVFNSFKQCTEEHGSATKTNEQVARSMAHEYELWLIENFNAAEGFDNADDIN